MYLISDVEKNIFENGNCTIDMVGEKPNEVYAIRFEVNDAGVLDVHAFIDTYDRDCWETDGDYKTSFNSKARITKSQYFHTFSTRDELLTVLGTLTCKMIVSEPAIVKVRQTIPTDEMKVANKKAAYMVNLITSSMLKINNKDLATFLSMDNHRIVDFLKGSIIMTSTEFLESDILDAKCEDVVRRYNGMLELHREMDTGLNQDKINEARQIWYKLQEDKTDKNFKVPTELRRIK